MATLTVIFLGIEARGAEVELKHYLANYLNLFMEKLRCTEIQPKKFS